MPQHPRVLHCTDPIFTSSSMEAVQKYRFKPATRIADGQPVPVVVTVEINFHGGDQPAPGEPSPRFRYGFSSPPGMTTTEPDENGVYPLSKNLNVPQMKTFVDDGFDLAMSRFPNGFRCSVLLTLDKKGKPLSAHVLKCDEPALEEPVMKSLLESKYRPARLNGKSVPVTMCVTVMHEGVGSHAETAGGQAQHESKP